MIIDLPNLEKVTLGYDSFHNDKNSQFYSIIPLYFFILDLPKLNKIAVGHSTFWCKLYAFAQKKNLNFKNGGYSIVSRATSLEILSGSCNEADIRDLSFNGYNEVKKVVVGSNNFQNADRLTIDNLHFLQTVSIGSNSFTNHADSFGSNVDRELTISNCTSLTNVTTDSYAFSDYNNLSMNGM